MSLDNLTSGNVKAAMKQAGASSSDLWMVPIEDIRVLEGFNIRTHNAEYEAHVIAIGESILENGYMRDKPLAGYVAKEGDANVIYITDGHSRLSAVAYANERGAGITTLPVVTKAAGTSIEDLTIGLVISNSGKPLSPIEKAAVCKRLVGYGMPEAEIAARLGFTKGYVQDLLLLISAPKAIRKMVEAGEVNASNACDAIKKHGNKAAEVLESKLSAVKAAGKKALTKKDIKPKRDMVGEGIWFIHENRGKFGTEVESHLALLAYVSKVPLDVVMARFNA